MRTIKVRGLVLKEYETGEADKRILLLCKEYGRVMAYARGARKPRSKFMAAAQIFTYSDFVLAQGRGFFSVAQADVIESFYDLRTDYDTLCAAHSIVDACDKTLWENSDCDQLLKLVLKSLSVLAKKRFQPKQVTAVFLLRFFDFYGFRPNADGCAECGAQGSSYEGKFFWSKEGLLCEKHNSRSEAFEISKAATTAASFILNSELSQAFMFEAVDSVLDELQRAVQLLWRIHFAVD
ncbi:MAG: DNA repair protein RecO [Defluviitaleaceae bacterium]|nr:DNA repair protein RecO [Defluviitaleaceae bacterium]MCL2261998.1 DNA repair protein RecO [Defluviitaleaceae bacterium]